LDEVALTKKEFKRVQSAICYIVTKMKLEMSFTLDRLSIKDKKEYIKQYGDELGIMMISRTNRGSQDKNSFIISFDEDQTRLLSMNRLKQCVFHEIIHALTWPFLDELDYLLNNVKDKKVLERSYKEIPDIRENVTYRMERLFGPLCFPHLKWEKP
jgi:hypothetical protein